MGNLLTGYSAEWWASIINDRDLYASQQATDARTRARLFAEYRDRMTQVGNMYTWTGEIANAIRERRKINPTAGPTRAESESLRSYASLIQDELRSNALQVENIRAINARARTRSDIATQRALAYHAQTAEVEAVQAETVAAEVRRYHEAQARINAAASSHTAASASYVHRAHENATAALRVAHDGPGAAQADDVCALLQEFGIDIVDPTGGTTITAAQPPPQSSSAESAVSEATLDLPHASRQADPPN